MSTKRRPPTAEEKAAAQARRDAFKALGKQIAAMSDAERAAIVANHAAVLTIEGRPLSLANTIGLITQLPTVSVVGGFWQWKKAGRKVAKGARSLALWIPAFKGGETAEAEEATDGEAKAGRKRFVVGSVFDITQTEPETV